MDKKVLEEVEKKLLRLRECARKEKEKKSRIAKVIREYMTDRAIKELLTRNSSRIMLCHIPDPKYVHTHIGAAFDADGPCVWEGRGWYGWVRKSVDINELVRNIVCGCDDGRFNDREEKKLRTIIESQLKNNGKMPGQGDAYED